jgi:hypothetical protein
MSGLEPARRGRQILAPRRAEGPDGLVGVGIVELSPGDPDYDMWDKYLKSQRQGRSAAGKRVGRG